jgi:hypothetical protein
LSGQPSGQKQDAYTTCEFSFHLNRLSNGCC